MSSVLCFHPSSSRWALTATSTFYQEGAHIPGSGSSLSSSRTLHYWIARIEWEHVHPRSPNSHSVASTFRVIFGERSPWRWTLWILSRYLRQVLSPIAVAKANRRSQTCRILNALLTERTLWMRVLRSVFQRLGPFIPSYSVRSMSSQELQRAATGPWRWKTIGTEFLTTSLKSADTVPPRRVRDVEITPRCVRLIPGGRFMVTLSLQSQSTPPDEVCPATVTLWDIGLPGAGVHDGQGVSTIVATHTVSPGALQRMIISRRIIDVSIVGETTIRIALVLYLAFPNGPMR